MLAKILRALIGGCPHEDILDRGADGKLRLKCLHCLRTTGRLLDDQRRRYVYTSTVSTKPATVEAKPGGVWMVEGGPAPDGTRLEDMTQYDRRRIQGEFNHPSVLPS